MLIIILIALLFAVIYIFNKQQFSYWKRLGIPQLNPSFIFGDIKDLILQTKATSTFFEEIYQKTKKEPILGLYFSYKPTLLINDLELAKRILGQDFQTFHDRGFYVDPKIDPLTANLFCLSGNKWKELRHKSTHVFSTAKLKMMLPIIQKNFEMFENTTDAHLAVHPDLPIDLKDYSTKLALSTISSIAFGIENDFFKDPENSFRKMTLKVLEPIFTNNARLMSSLLLPDINKKFSIRFFPKEVNEFYVDLVKDIVKYREENQIERKDFLNSFLQLRNDDIFKDEEVENFTLSDVAANSFIFILAGYETTSSTIAFCLYELAKNPKVLEKAQKEIDDLADEKFCMEKVKKLKYLENCINETLRKYPVLPFLNRTCNEDYKVANSSCFIPKDTPVLIPIYAIQRDPEIYPDPLSFIPERFEDTDVPLLSFGHGSRTCIGKRMALISTKCYILSILSKYNIELISPKEDLTFSPKVPSLAPNQKILIRFTKRHT